MYSLIPKSRFASSVGNGLFNSASLDLAFAKTKSLVDATTGQNLVTFTRASSGTYVDSQGVIRTATTNLLLRSEEFNNVAWVLNTTGTGIAPVLTANYATAPNGTLTAYRLQANRGAGNNSSDASNIAQPVSGLSDPHTVTISIWAKSNTGNSQSVYFRNATGSGGSVIVVTADWQRFSITGTRSGNTNNNIQIGSRGGINADNSVDILIWGAQLEQSSTVGEYIPTTSTINSAPRFDHNPTTGESLGLLVEEQRTNLCLQSEAWDTSPWTSTAPYSVTANVIASPDGTQTADALIVASGSSSFTTNVTRQVITKAASAIQYTRTAYFKALGLTTSVRVSDFGTSTVNGASAVISLVDGSIITAPSVAGAFSGASVVVSNAGNGWWRVAFTYTTDTATSLTIRSFPYVGAGVLTGDGSSGLYVWGAQLEAGSFPTSYIPTTTAAVTRSADVASITGSNFSSWANNNEGTIFSDSSIIASQIKTQAVWELSGGTALSSLRQPQGTANQFRAVIGGTFTGSPGTGASLTTGVTRAAVAYSGESGRLQVGDSGADATGSALNATSLSIGSLAGATQLNGCIKRLTYWPARLANSTLQQITQ